jgi:hypothetical protein
MQATLRLTYGDGRRAALFRCLEDGADEHLRHPARLWIRQRRRRPYDSPSVPRNSRTPVIKEAVGVHVFLTRSLFACGILRRLLPLVSLVKSTFGSLLY